MLLKGWFVKRCFCSVYCWTSSLLLSIKMNKCFAFTPEYALFKNQKNYWWKIILFQNWLKNYGTKNVFNKTKMVFLVQHHPNDPFLSLLFFKKCVHVDVIVIVWVVWAIDLSHWTFYMLWYCCKYKVTHFPSCHGPRSVWLTFHHSLVPHHLFRRFLLCRMMTKPFLICSCINLVWSTDRVSWLSPASGARTLNLPDFYTLLKLAPNPSWIHAVCSHNRFRHWQFCLVTFFFAIHGSFPWLIGL